MGGQAKTKSARVINGGEEGKGRGQRERGRMQDALEDEGACYRTGRTTSVQRAEVQETDGDADSPGRTLARLHH